MCTNSQCVGRPADHLLCGRVERKSDKKTVVPPYHTIVPAYSSFFQPPFSMPPLRIGIVGGGTVGGGVWELLHQNAAVSIQKIVVRSLRPRDYAAPSDLFTTQMSDVLSNPDIDCVVEVMGGTDTAKDVVLQALKAGKAVVTANKALLAEHLTTVANAQVAANRPLMYEAAVCGGIPIINILQTAYTGDKIQSIEGILNGTTNYMLSKMDQEGADYAAVLKEAQDLRYAEADPTADVEGHDARAKVALLAKLAFGITVEDVTTIPCQGISQITTTDFAYAKASQSTIKLVGTATQASPSSVAIYVAPVMLPLTHTLAGIHGAGNAVTVTSQNMGPCLYTGPGAGRYPTANSVVADILRVAAQPTYAPVAFAKPSTATLETNYTAKFYLRASGTAALPSAETIANWAQECGVPTPQVLDGATVQGSVAFSIDSCTKNQMDALVAKFPSECSVLAMPKI